MKNEIKICFNPCKVASLPEEIKKNILNIEALEKINKEIEDFWERIDNKNNNGNTDGIGAMLFGLACYHNIKFVVEGFNTLLEATNGIPEDQLPRDILLFANALKSTKNILKELLDNLSIITSGIVKIYSK